LIRDVQKQNPNAHPLDEFCVRSSKLSGWVVRRGSLALVLVLGLAGCGQKGPLYMPTPEFPAPPKASTQSQQDPKVQGPVKP
jgi:predicted small lipoprotein YifL